MTVALTINDASDFRIVIPFITDKVEKESEEYKFAASIAKELVSLLQFIQRNAEDKHNEMTFSSLNRSNNSTKFEAVDAVKNIMNCLI